MAENVQLFSQLAAIGKLCFRISSHVQEAKELVIFVKKIFFSGILFLHVQT